MIDQPPPANKLELKTIDKGRRLVQVLLAILKTHSEGITRVGVNQADYKILLDMLQKPCSIRSITLHRVEVLIESVVEEDMLCIHTKEGVSKVFVEDVWVILHPEQETRLHRVLREGVI